MSAEPADPAQSIATRDATCRLNDGTELVARLWFPSCGGPWPALVMRQPYGRSIASTVTYAHPRWWAEHGFLVVIQDVRGMGASSGVFRGFSQEASDGAATLTWVRSLPECNGRLGCYGFSYQGLTQLLCQGNVPPPDCLAPAMAGLAERDHWSCDGGAQWWHLGLGWGLQLAALEAQRRQDHQVWLELREALEDNSYLRRGPELLRRHAPDGMARQWLEADPEDQAAWTIHPVSERWLRQPLLLLGGCWDPHLNGILDLWRRARAVGGQPDLHIGPATHLHWWPEAQMLMLRFFQRHLQDVDPGRPEAQALIWNLTERCWTPIDPAPMPPSEPWTLQGNTLANLDPEIGVLSQGSQGCGSVVLVHDPWRPAPAVGGHLGVQPGAADRQQLDARSDVVTFTSAPLRCRQTLSGQPQLTIRASADQPGYDLCVALSRLPAGATTVEQLSTGTLRIRGEGAKTSTRQTVALQPFCASLNPDDRLRISIAAAAWPAIGVNSGTPDVPCGAPSPQHRVVTMTLELADSALSLNPYSSGRLSSDTIQLP